MNIVLNIVGIIAVLGLMYALSFNRKAVDYRFILKAIGIQFLVTVVITKIPMGIYVIEKISDAVAKVLSYGYNGLGFVFGSLAKGDGASGFIFIVQVLGNIIFISALVSVLFYSGILGFVIAKIGWVVGKVLGTSKVESFISVANIFLGQTESPLLVSKYLPNMTRSEIMMILVSGMGSMSVSILGGYAALGIPVKYLIIASVMVPVGSIIVGKILLPETEEAVDVGEIRTDFKGGAENVIEATSNGAVEGVQLVIAIGACLVAIIAIVSMANGFLSNFGITLEKLLGAIFYPAAYLMGLPAEHVAFAGELMGCKMVLNEFVSFDMLGKVIANMDERTGMMLAVSQAGFANLGSMGVCIAGIGSLCPEKKAILSQLVFKAMLGGFFVSVLNAMFIGIVLFF